MRWERENCEICLRFQTDKQGSAEIDVARSHSSLTTGDVETSYHGRGELLSTRKAAQTLETFLSVKNFPLAPISGGLGLRGRFTHCNIYKTSR